MVSKARSVIEASLAPRVSRELLVPKAPPAQREPPVPLARQGRRVSTVLRDLREIADLLARRESPGPPELKAAPATPASRELRVRQATMGSTVFQELLA